MKTTIDIPDALFKQAKRLAVRRNANLRTVINEALRNYVDSCSKLEDGAIEIHTVGGNGLKKGLSWDDWSGDFGRFAGVKVVNPLK